MTADDSLSVAAAQAGIKLSKYAFEPSDLHRISGHLEALNSFDTAPKSTQSQSAPKKPSPLSDTRASRFTARNFHVLVVNRSKKSFVAGEYQDAVLKAFRSVNNRVKVLTGLAQDGAALMGLAFNNDNPRLEVNNRKTESERNEHEGTRFMMMGAMTGMRNPRAHEDHWSRDKDEAYVLDALSYASLLHRILDAAEERNSKASAAQ